MNNILFVLIFCLGPFQDSSRGSAIDNDPEIKAALDLIIQESIEATKSQPKTKIENGIPAFNIPIPSIVAGYQQFGHPLRVGAAGVRKWEADELVSVSDLVHIGSCTKAMTATLIGRLIDQKKLTFETTLKEGLPHLADKIHKDYHDVTLLQLMTHRAGVPRDAFWSGYEDQEITERRNSIVAKALASKPLKPLDNSYAYSNLSYCLVGMIAAKTANTSWEDLIQREIFDVLGMDSAGFGPPGTKDKIDQPWGHLPVGMKLFARQGDNPPPLGPAGTIHLSMADWAKFGLAHAGCSQPKVVSDKTLAKLHEVVKQNDDDPNEYACGWIVTQRPWAQGTALLHNGSNTMWYATIWVAPNTKSVYMTAVNAGLNTTIVKAADRCIGDLIGIHREASVQTNK